MNIRKTFLLIIATTLISSSIQSNELRTSETSRKINVKGYEVNYSTESRRTSTSKSIPEKQGEMLIITPNGPAVVPGSRNKNTNTAITALTIVVVLFSAMFLAGLGNSQ